MSPIQVVITKEEQKAIKELRRCAKKWPETLQLFSWSGNLVVMKDHDGRRAILGSIHGIQNDGGDPDCGESPGEVMYEHEYEVVKEATVNCSARESRDGHEPDRGGG